MTTQPLEPGFMLIHGNRAEELCDIAIKWLVQNPLEALEPEVILVQSAGVAQWLQQKIAQAGIAAALDFVLPASFVWRAYKTVLGDAEIPEKSLLGKDMLIWQIYRLLDSDWGHDTAVRNFLNNADNRKKFQLAEHLASLYDQYQVYRADWLNQWEQGANVIIDKQNRLLDLPENQVWQADLWRLILKDTQNRFGNTWGRAQIHQRFLDELNTDEVMGNQAGLPRRILVFGISTMPKQILESLVALSARVQVLVFINNPCEYYWGDIQGEYEVLRSSLKRQQKKPGLPMTINAEDLHNHVQPLLASWGRQGRDFIAMLDGFDTEDRRAKSSQLLARIEHKIDVFNKLPGINLLQQLQDDIRDLRSPAESKNWPVVDSQHDKSIEFHIAYSKQRELEVLHDQLLAAFSQDPDLKPADVIVMVPDIAAYAPHIEAVFGQYDVADKRYLPFTIADMGQRNNDPLVVALEKLLTIAQMRFGAQEISDLLDVPAVRAKFNIDLDDLPIIRQWIGGANIRWGLNQQHKSELTGATINNNNTWDFGLMRMILGYASGNVNGNWQNIYPYGEPGGIQAEVLGNLANLLHCLDIYRTKFKENLIADDWAATINCLIDAVFQPETTQDEATILRFKQVLYDWQEICHETGFVDKLPIKIVADYCLEQLDQSYQAPRFLAGAISFATLMPMRAIPFKYICLLGMQDGDFPRNQTPDDFDLMVLYPKPGDRSRRDDDRYLFLEALLSAREKLYISWVGLSIIDGSEQPPSVLVSQLTDHIANIWQHKNAGTDLISALTSKHPLQPFSKKYLWQFDDSKSPDNCFTYAREWLSAQPPVVQASEFNIAVSDNIFGLKDIQDFLRHPVRYFYRRSLNINFDDYSSDLNDDESYELNSLELWRLKSDILALAESEDSSELGQYKKNTVLQGYLPPGNTADFIFADVDNIISPIFDIYAANKKIYANLLDPVEINISLDNDQKFHELIKNIRCNADGKCQRTVLQASKVITRISKKSAEFNPGHIAAVWAGHLILNAWFKPVETVMLCPTGVAVFKPVETGLACRIFNDLWLSFSTGIKQAIAAHPVISCQYLTIKDSPENKVYLEINKCFDEFISEDLYIAHAFKSFEEFFEPGEFIAWSKKLYGAISSNTKFYNLNEYLQCLGN